MPGKDKSLGLFETDESSVQVIGRAFERRKGSDTNVIHTAMRAGYHEPFKGRVGLEQLRCSDGVALYRLTVDGSPLLYEDESAFGGWMTYDQLLCWLEGYRRLSEFERFLGKSRE